MGIELQNIRKGMRLVEDGFPDIFLALADAQFTAWNGSRGWLCRVLNEKTQREDQFFEDERHAGSLKLFRIE